MAINLTASVPHTTGAPTHNPGALGSRIAYDSTGGHFYQWVSGTTWAKMPLGQAYLDSLVAYDSDATAGAGGVALGAYYLTAEDHKEAPGGLPKKRLV